MRVLVLTTQHPFMRGGAELLAEGLVAALHTAGHAAEVVAVPFKWYPPERIPEQVLACRLLDLTESAGRPIDRVIGLKFPAYLVPHPRKVLWLLHQHRQAYDLWDHPAGDLIQFPNGLEVRDLVRESDRRLIPEARAVFTLSANVSARLERWSAIRSTPLYHPPAHAEAFATAAAEDWLFFPSRITTLKRQELAIRALARTREPVRLRFAGTAEMPSYTEKLRYLAEELSLGDRVEWLGEVSEEEKRDLYARSLGVVFPPRDEDYGYVTLEAMLSAKPVVTCTDSGGPIEFVLPGRTGLVAEPEAEPLAAAMDALWADRAGAREMGLAGRRHYEEMAIGWPEVVRRLLA